MFTIFFQAGECAYHGHCLLLVFIFTAFNNVQLFTFSFQSLHAACLFFE